MVEKSKIFVITGGCGFIGAHLAHALVARGDQVRIIDDLSTGHRNAPPAEAEFTLGDVADSQAVREILTGADGVFHLAAIASVEKCNQNWREAHRTNMGGTVTVMEAARDAASRPIPVAWASSAAVYGVQDTFPITEDAPKNPLSPYGADKLSGELHGAAAAGLFDLPNTALRFFNVFGPGQDPSSPYSGVISIFADRLARGLPITIYGDGQQSRDFIYVGDIVAGLIAAMERMLETRAAGGPSRFDAINLCTGIATTVQELAGTIKRLLNAPGEILHAEPRSGDIRHSTGDPTLMRWTLDLNVQTPFEDGLRLLLDHQHMADVG